MNYQKINTILMRVIAVLLMLVMLSTAAVTGRFARYISSSTGSDSARVAKFDVDYTLTPVEGKTGEFTLQVTNKSEVAVEYSVSVTFKNDLAPTNMEAKIKLSEDNIKVGIYDDTNTFTFGEIGKLAPGETGTAYPLTFTVEDHKLITDGAENTNTPETATKELKFNVAVTAVQID